MSTIFYYGTGSWDELIDIQQVPGWREVEIHCRATDGSDGRRTRRHRTAFRTNMLVLDQVPQGHPYQWAASDEGQEASHLALAELQSRYPWLPDHLLGTERLVKVMIASRRRDGV